MRKHRFGFVMLALIAAALCGIAYVKQVMRAQIEGVGERSIVSNSAPPAASLSSSSMPEAPLSRPTASPARSVAERTNWREPLLLTLGQVVYDDILDRDELTPEALEALRGKLFQAKPEERAPATALLDPDRYDAETIIAHLLEIIEQAVPASDEPANIYNLVWRDRGAQWRAVLNTHLRRWDKAQEALREMTDALEKSAAFDAQPRSAWFFSFPKAEAQYLIPRLIIPAEIRARWDALLANESTSQALQEGVERMRRDKDYWNVQGVPVPPTSPHAIANAREYISDFKPWQEIRQDADLAKLSSQEMRALAKRYVEAASKAQKDLYKGVLGDIPAIRRLNFVYPNVKEALEALSLSSDAIYRALNGRAICDDSATLRSVLRAAFALEDYRAAKGAYPERMGDAPEVATAFASMRDETLYRPQKTYGEYLVIAPFSVTPPHYERTATGYAFRIEGKKLNYRKLRYAGKWEDNPPELMDYWTVFLRPDVTADATLERGVFSTTP